MAGQSSGHTRSEGERPRKRQHQSLSGHRAFQNAHMAGSASPAQKGSAVAVGNIARVTGTPVVALKKVRQQLQGYGRCFFVASESLPDIGRIKQLFRF